MWREDGPHANFWQERICCYLRRLLLIIKQETAAVVLSFSKQMFMIYNQNLGSIQITVCPI